MTEEELLLELKKNRKNKPRFHQQFIIFLTRIGDSDIPFYISFTVVATLFVMAAFTIFWYGLLVALYPAFLLLLLPPVLFSLYRAYEFIRRIE